MFTLGIVGLGHLGEIHLKQWLQILDINQIYVCDMSAERCQKIQEIYQVQVLSSFEQILEKCEVIDIVTPTDTHFSLAEKAMLLSKHIFIEKPVCETMEQLERLIQIQDKTKSIVQIGFVERYNPAFTAMKDRIQEPRFFEIHRLAPFNPRGTEVSVIMDLMIHDLDILCYFESSPVKSISATGVSIISKTPDIANARIEFESGCVANITSSRISMKRMRKMRIFSDKMYANLDFLEKYSELYEIKEIESQEGVVFTTHEGKEKKLIYSKKEKFNVNSIFEELSDFKKHINTDNINTLASLQSSKYSLELAIKIHEILQL